MRLLIVTQAVDKEDSVLGFFHRWIEEFAKHFEKVSVICLREGAHTLPENVHVYSLGKEKGRRSRFMYAARFLALTWKLRGEYDAVFVHMNKEYVLLAGPLWRLLGKRVGLWYTHGTVTIMLHAATLLAHYVFTASKESFRLQTRKVRVVGHGIDTEMFRGSPRIGAKNKVLRLITVGRIAKTKRLLDMLTILDDLHRRHVAFSFSIVGAPAVPADYEYKHQLESEVARRPYRESIRMIGSLSHQQLPALLADADLFLNLSRTGSIDKAVLEALAAGVRVVTSNEAFFTPIPNVTYIPNIESSSISNIISILAEDTDNRGRSYVEKNHSLTNLIRTMTAELTKKEI